MSPVTTPKKPSQSEKVVCRCLGVTEGQLVEAIQTQAISTLDDVVEQTQAGDGCTACHPLIRRYLKKLGRTCEQPCSDPCQDGQTGPGWAAA